MRTAFTLFMLLLSTSAYPQDHVHPGQAPIPDVVGKFYETWNKPPARTSSCCNKYDCSPVTMIRKDGKWYAVGHKLWKDPVEIPEHILEQNLLPPAEPRESPDHQSHACIQVLQDEMGSGPPYITVLCATLGIGR